jgi:hypothetical protein
LAVPASDPATKHRPTPAYDQSLGRARRRLPVCPGPTGHAGACEGQRANPARDVALPMKDRRWRCGPAWPMMCCRMRAAVRSRCVD